MGWANCGKDSKGRPIGYAVGATCDHPGCDAKIDRGLGYVCGTMHGNTDFSCEKYFCEKHKTNYVMMAELEGNVCDECAERLINCDEVDYDEEEGAFVDKV